MDKESFGKVLRRHKAWKKRVLLELLARSIAIGMLRLGRQRLLHVALICIIVSSVASPSTAQTYGLQRDVVRVLGPVDHTENPKDLNGIVWTAPGFDDRRWSTGSLTEKNSAPARKSRLYRQKIAVSEPPPDSIRVMLRATADDGFAVWFDGFALGEWGKKSQPSGSRTVDITNRLSPGVHTMAIRLDNGTGDSLLEADLLVLDVDSPDFLKTGNWFWRNFNSDKEEEREEAITRARRVMELYPKDMSALEYGFASYYYVEPRNIEAARDIMESALQQKLVFAPGTFCSLLSSLGDHSRALSFARETDWARSSPGTREYYEGSALVSMGKPEQARNVLMNSRFPPGSSYERLNACLDAGLLPPTLGLIKREADTCEKDGKHPGGVGGLLVRLGDYARARTIYARWYQADRKGAAGALAGLAYRTGDFQQAERFYKEQLGDITVTSTRGQQARREVQARLILTLAAQGHMDDVKGLAREMDLTVFPNQPAYCEEAIYGSLYPRLQVAMALNDEKHIAEEAQRLLNAIRERFSRCSCNDIRAEVLLDLAEALKQAGRNGEMQEVCGFVVQGTVGSLDIALPENQAALGRAHAMLGDRDAALKCLTDASLLAPDDYWILKELDALKTTRF